MENENENEMNEQINNNKKRRYQHRFCSRFFKKKNDIINRNKNTRMVEQTTRGIVQKPGDDDKKIKLLCVF